MANLEILQNYNYDEDEEVCLYYAKEILELEDGIIPNDWKDALSEMDCEDRISKVIEMWKEVLPQELFNVIAYMEDNLDDVELMSIGDKFYLLYSIYTVEEGISYFVGGNPMDSNLDEFDNYDSKNLKKIRVFYEKLHNGFYNYINKAMGLVETSDIICFGDDEWGIIEELEEPLQINLDSTYGFYENGVGGYVAIDMQSDKCVIWYADDQPKYDVAFWKLMDMLLTMAMKDESNDDKEDEDDYEDEDYDDDEYEEEDDDNYEYDEDDDDVDYDYEEDEDYEEEEYDEEDLIADRRDPDWSFDYDELEKKYAKSVGPEHAKEMVDLRKQADALYTEEGILYIKDLEKFNALLAESQRIGFKYYIKPEEPVDEDISKYEEYMISDEEMEEIMSRMKVVRNYGMMKNIYNKAVGKIKGEICLRLFKKSDSLLEADFSVTDENKPEWERILKQIDEILDGK